ncbi:MAG TPA: co-chaperone GroES [Bdellovibrionales bacterium]|nr:co-chaperone GroES [Bdellovibrionales bacterium]
MAKKKAKPAKKAAAKKTSASKKSAKKVVKKAAARPAKKAAKKPAKSAAKKAAPKKPAAKKSVSPMKAAPIAAKSVTKKSSVDLSGLFSPLDDRIVVEEIGASNRTPGGLYIPDTMAESDRPREGRVLAVGRGHREKKGRLRPLDVQLGDIVLFEKYVGSTISIADTDFMVLRESNILGIISPR